MVLEKLQYLQFGKMIQRWLNTLQKFSDPFNGEFGYFLIKHMKKTNEQTFRL